MLDYIADPKTMTAAERLIFRAMLTKVYSGGYGLDRVTRPTDQSLVTSFEAAFRVKSLTSFLDFGNYNVAFEWAMLVVGRLTNDRVSTPRKHRDIKSWEAVVAEIRDLVSVAAESDRKDQQEDLDDRGLETLRSWNSQSVVADGKVIDPWGPATSVPLNWFLDNMTLTGVYLVYVAVNEAVQDNVSENLLSWAAGQDEGRDTRTVATQAFETGCRTLEKDIEALLAKDAPAAVAPA